MSIAVKASSEHAWEFADPSYGGGRDDTREAIDTFTEWLACPCEKHAAYFGCSIRQNGLAWCPCSCSIGTDKFSSEAQVRSIIDAARVSSESGAREAICSELIEWALA